MHWYKRVGLRTRVLSLLGTLVVVTLAGGAVMIWYTYQMDELMDRVVNREVAALEQSEEMVTELSMQKGYVSYYFMTGDEKWLSELETHRRRFAEGLMRVKDQACSEEERTVLSQVESEYNEYIRTKDQVIALYRVGEKEKGEQLHEQMRPSFFKILGLCDQFTRLHKQHIQTGLDRSRAEARKFRLVAAAAMTGAAGMGVLLAFILLAQILAPIRQLARETSRTSTAPAGNEIKDLKESVRGLIKDADHTRGELARSREMLFISEKLAVVGKLAADVAHSIRNPMTSIKMRLFSLERSLDLTPNQKEDFAVVAEEMRRLDNIVRNFLEFSRPPKLKKQKVNVADTLDMTVQLLQHRLELGGVEVEMVHRHPAPVIEADPELLKEVLVNFIVNACEAMTEGGQLRIVDEKDDGAEMDPGLRVRISDNGPGVPADLREKVFEPFFSTKEEGTGLGLSIALRIIEEHGGRLELDSSADGTTFTITLPVMEKTS